ncbi:radical SAM protein [Thermosipho melanesiensis]|uniref:Radical SAM domain protein n=2 Tax=Thermosipho melanesiensis TaxID=46541 RepID=A6LJ71_THEM4|nr:radical SAM protein [Thermosipho melanesiensis]ABR29972.1 Radical SAM domain protein [Thermosipho melanesiensis BI429]APT73176.1 radical SAM protein [Thermosipho melanesiensis]OOC38572.1 radical SAM protein [Thermosipho melanesiensis]OOC40376.1 radical SAM protein [Thermosipho melanesiensis]OOC40640.1 radical SAM protein [Thermosipho melanesiensis]
MRKPKIVEFELTTACNYSCKHCYCNAGKKSKIELTLEQVKHVLDELRNGEVELVDLVGGEPLLRQDIFDIIKYGVHVGLGVMLNTNASLASKDVVNKLKGIYPELKVGISFDGSFPEIHEFVRGKGTFEKTYNGFLNFLEAGFEVTILHVINKKNYLYFEDMIKFAKKHNVSLYVDRFVPVGRGKLYKDILIPTKKEVEYVRSLIDKYKDTVNFYVEENIFSGMCTAGRTHASVLVDGTVVPCGHFRYDKEYYMGNLNEKSFKEIWESFNPDVLLNSCKNCEFFENCFGGCRAFAKKLNLKHDPIFCRVMDNDKKG